MLGANALHNLAVVKGFNSTIAVRLNEPSNAELGSSKVSNHSEQDLGQVICANDPKNRRASGVGGFAIVAAPVVVAVVSQHPGVRHVSRGVMFLSEGLQMELDVFLSLDGKTVPKVLGPFGFEQSFARGKERVVAVFHAFERSALKAK